MTPALPTLFVSIPSHTPPGRLVFQAKPFPSSLARPLEQTVEKDKNTEKERERRRQASPNFGPPSLPLTTTIHSTGHLEGTHPYPINLA